jgi:hypothetical protein
MNGRGGIEPPRHKDTKEEKRRKGKIVKTKNAIIKMQ